MIATLFFAHGRIRKRIFWAHHTTPSRTPRLAPFQSSRRHVSRCQPCFLDSQLVQPPASTIPQSKRVFRWPHQISAPAHPYRIMASRGHAGGRGGGEGRDGAVSAAAASWARRASRAVPARPSHFRAARSSRLASDSIARRPASSCSYSPALRCVSSVPSPVFRRTTHATLQHGGSFPCRVKVRKMGGRKVLVLLTCLFKHAQKLRLYLEVWPCQAQAGARQVHGKERVLLNEISGKDDEQTRCVVRSEHFLLSGVVVPYCSAPAHTVSVTTPCPPCAACCPPGRPCAAQQTPAPGGDRSRGGGSVQASGKILASGTEPVDLPVELLLGARAVQEHQVLHVRAHQATQQLALGGFEQAPWEHLCRIHRVQQAALLRYHSAVRCQPQPRRPPQKPATGATGAGGPGRPTRQTSHGCSQAPSRFATPVMCAVKARAPAWGILWARRSASARMTAGSVSPSGAPPRARRAARGRLSAQRTSRAGLQNGSPAMFTRRTQSRARRPADTPMGTR